MCGVMVSMSCFPSMHLLPMLECRFESRLGLDFLGFSLWHFFLKLVFGVSLGFPVFSPSSLVHSFSQRDKSKIDAISTLSN